MKRVEKNVEQFVPEEKTPNEDRLVMLCDGVFAIAITLLVLDIGIHVTQGNLSEKQFIDNVDGALWDLIQPTISYLVTFLIIAMYWRIHRRLMLAVQHVDNHFISLTFLFLAFIAFFPVTSKLLGDYADARSVVIIYTLGLSGCGFSALALWLYATWRHRLVSPDLPQAEIHARTYSLLLTPLIFCVSLLLLFIIPLYKPYYICFSWALIGIIHKLGQIIYIHWLEKPVRVLIDIVRKLEQTVYNHWLEKPVQALRQRKNKDGMQLETSVISTDAPTTPMITQSAESSVQAAVRVEANLVEEE